MQTIYVIQAVLSLMGLWICWVGVSVSKVEKLEGIRALPIWFRVLMVITGVLCLSAAVAIKYFHIEP